MSYGLEIASGDNHFTGDDRLLRLVDVLSVTTSGGSYYVPNFNSAGNYMFFPIELKDSHYPSIGWDDSAKRLTVSSSDYSGYVVLALSKGDQPAATGYGAAFKNAASELVIDSAYQNIEVAQTGVAYSSSSNGAHHYYAITMPAGINAMPFIYPGAYRFYVVGIQNNQYKFAIVNTSGAPPVPYFIAAPHVNSNVNYGYGMNIRHPVNKKIVYSTNRVYPKLKQVAVISGSNGTKTHDSADMTDYVSVEALGYGEGFCNVIFAMTMQRVNATTISVTNEPVPYSGDLGAGIQWTTNPTAKILFGKL